MARKDHYYNKAKQEGYRTRAAYKLKQLDAAENLIEEGDVVVDLGAAPGGWTEVAAEKVGETGTVIAVDRQRVDAVDADAQVEYVRGDMTDESTREEVVEIAGKVDAVVSDMAPNMTGEYNLDHARSAHLARQAFETALEVLDSGGDFAAKIFQGQDLEPLREDIDEEFKYVRTMAPDASRDESSEVYLVAKSRLTAPVSAGDELEVEIEDVGSEGDGIASVEGFRLFVPGAETGETVRVRVDEIKERFGFAERID
ncbi:23S rRNA Um-2552 2'-O-methyltransferase [Natronoarchaeum philippinense]|uniref:Ribosomal RNA large subunit methyltransferase E n=1 Tax=Natronoarchaeum philippinense TaxID=558529 RepID=A0A285P2X7_NATPI|nr:23S rRNA (uridine(2552)-2'-O)-methyltransferase [Natronoarchaeum philippinense]SNZ15617.1 23S rRNA Um-2552 2'-O-methyltransferase [Natronoarchaeum philippinense]